MRVTMKEVAQVMGVSVMTVSNAFNRPDQLSSDLRERILARAAKMGYAGPDAAARHLRSGRTNAYAVIFEERLSYAFSDPFSVLWLQAFSRVMEERGASVQLLSVTAGDERSCQAVRDASVDGVAGLCVNTAGMQVARERGLPTVACSLSHRVGDPRNVGGHVVIDDFAAGRDLAQHLVALGHERVTVLVEGSHSTPVSGVFTAAELAATAEAHGCVSFLDSWLRHEGIMAGLGGADVRVVVAGPNDATSGRAAAADVLDQRDRPTAVIAVSDTLALGFMEACRARGLQPGRDISVGGFDDLPQAAVAGLTTIAQPVADKGRIAAELLLDPKREPRQVVLPHRLVVRASTQPVPTA